jgi:hypothetical protein
VSAAVGVVDDAQPDEVVPRNDDKDERMYPELVDEFSKQAMEDEYQEEPSSLTRFDDTDDEEKEENADMLVPEEYDGEDMPTIEWDRNDPKLTPGTIFESMMDCWNALTTYCILTQNDFVIDKSEPRRLTIHCPYERWRWRLHASRMRTSKYIQVFNFADNISFSDA